MSKILNKTIKQGNHYQETVIYSVTRFFLGRDTQHAPISWQTELDSFIFLDTGSMMYNACL